MSETDSGSSARDLMAAFGARAFGSPDVFARHGLETEPELVYLAPGQALFEQGEPGDSMYLLLYEYKLMAFFLDITGNIPISSRGCQISTHPGNSPFSRGGRVVYRNDRPMEIGGPELAPYRVPPEILPLTRHAERAYGDRYQAITQVVMDRINELLDSEYQFATDAESDGVQGVARFL